MASHPLPTDGFADDDIPRTVITADSNDGSERWVIVSEFDPQAVYGASTYRTKVERYRWGLIADPGTPHEIMLCSPVQPRRGTVLWLTGPDGTTTTWEATGRKRRKSWHGQSKTINVEQIDDAAPPSRGVT